MIITHHREKLVNAIIYFAKHTKKCGKTKLLKLLYFLDFCHFKYTGKSVTALEYFAWEWGPVPKDLYQELSEKQIMKSDLARAITIAKADSFEKISPKQKFNDEYFTNREKKLLKNLSEIFRDANAEDMMEVTHLKNQPWDRTLREKGQFEKIDYLLSIDNAKGSLAYEEAKERMEEISETHQAFGAT